MNIQEQYFKGVPDYYPSMYLDGYTPQQIMYAVRNKMIREYKKRKMATVEPEMSSQKEQDKKKKKRQSILEAELFRIMEKSLKVAMD